MEIDLTIVFSRKIGMVPIILDKEQSGYITPQQVDKAWMSTMKMGIGIFGIIDITGLDVGWELLEQHALTSGDKQAKAIYEYPKTNFIEKGHLGSKTGQGFYKYPNPEYENPDFLK